MDILIFLIPVALILGVVGLCAFLWSLKHGQFENLDAEASRILFEEEARKPEQKVNSEKEK